MGAIDLGIEIAPPNTLDRCFTSYRRPDPHFKKHDPANLEMAPNAADIIVGGCLFS